MMVHLTADDIKKPRTSLGVGLRLFGLSPSVKASMEWCYKLHAEGRVRGGDLHGARASETASVFEHPKIDRIGECGGPEVPPELRPTMGR